MITKHINNLQINRMDTKYKNAQTERQALLIESGSECYYSAKNRGLASWKSEGQIHQRESRMVLKDCDREKNLYELIRCEVVEYMKEKEISWWHMEKEKDNEVTAHVLSSQVHCLNHLFAIRNDAKAIKAILKNATGIEFDEILPSIIDDGCLISFEFVFENKSMLNEEHETRGKKCTSIDALIYAKKGKEKWLVPVEWKYTEAYDHKKDAFNYSRYKDMPVKDSRLVSWHDLYKKEPFYELGRQTLLMEKIIEKHPEIASRFFHLVVIPVGNEEMRKDAKEFQDSLTTDGRNNFNIVSQEDLMTPIAEKYSELCEYLRTRYWE